MVKQNRFKIITPSFNNEDWVEYYAASILNQTYTNYEVMYFDDASTDGTYEKINSIVKDLPNWTITRNPVNKGATSNYFDHLSTVEDNDIVIHLDGDDWLIDETVLEKLNNFYIENNYWMTYGGFVCWDGSDEIKQPYPQSTLYPEFIQTSKFFRRDSWRASHMRTYKGFLIKKINRQDLISKIDNKDFWHASDLAFQYPCLEMCPKDKIGVVDFYTYVYNQSKSNTIRTQERESTDNAKYEIEIRNKKHYKEGLSGEKLPQINVIGYDLETNEIPKDFSLVYGLESGEFDATLINDMELYPYLKGTKPFPKGKIIADLHESPTYNPIQKEIYELVYKNSHLFDLILTYNPKLLELDNAKKRFTFFTCLNKNIHTKEWPLLANHSLYKVYDKNKLVSCISSNKAFLEGHKKRLEFVNHIRNREDLDLFGNGFNFIKQKLEGLKNYKFSVAIENTYEINECTEKITDCFLTGTIPIYYGCPNIGEIFNKKGILTFTTKSELDEILNDISINGDLIYKNKLKYIKENFNLAQQYRPSLDKIFNEHIKPII
jgi:glycosyltransferase involved in cell wall biosynthesis